MSVESKLAVILNILQMAHKVLDFAIKVIGDKVDCK